jgi:hypothetical protein
VIPTPPQNQNKKSGGAKLRRIQYKNSQFTFPVAYNFSG